MAEGGYNRNLGAGPSKEDHLLAPTKLNIDQNTGKYSAEVNATSGNQTGKMKMDINVKVNGNKTIPKVNRPPAREETKKKSKKVQDEKVTIDLKFTINVNNGKQKTTVTPVHQYTKDDDDEDDDGDDNDDEDTETEEKDGKIYNQPGCETSTSLIGAVGGVASTTTGGNYDNAEMSDQSVKTDVENVPRDRNKKRFDCLSGYDSGIHESHTDRGHSDTLVEESDGYHTPRLEETEPVSDVTQKRKTNVQRSQSQIRRNRAQKLKQALEREKSGVKKPQKQKRRASIADAQQYRRSSSLTRRPSFTTSHNSRLMVGECSEMEDSTDGETNREQLDTFIMLYKLKSFLKQNLASDKLSPPPNEQRPEQHEDTTDSVFSDNDDHESGLIRSAFVNLVHSQSGNPVKLPDGTTMTQPSALQRDPLELSDVPLKYDNSNLTDGLLKPSQTLRSPVDEAERRRVRSPSFRETLEHFIMHSDDPEVQRVRNPSVMETVGDMIHSGAGNVMATTPARNTTEDDDVFVNVKTPSVPIRKKSSNSDGRAEQIHHETVGIDRTGNSKAELIFSDPEDLANIDPHALGIDIKEGEQLKYMEVIVVDAEDASVGSSPAGSSKQLYQPIGILPFSDENEALIDKEINELSQNAGYMVSSSPFMTRSLPSSPKVRAKSFNIMRKISGGEYPPRSPDDPPMSPARRTFSVVDGPPRSPRTTRKTSTVDFYKQFYGKPKKQPTSREEDTCTPIERSHSTVIDKLDGLQFERALRGESIEGLGCMHRGHAGFVRGSSQSLDSNEEPLSARSDESRVFVFPDTNTRTRSRSNESSISDSSSGCRDAATMSPSQHRRTRRVGQHTRSVYPDFEEENELGSTAPGRKTSGGSVDSGGTQSSLELREVAQLQSPEARASPPVFRGLRKLTPNQQPDVSKLRSNRQESMISVAGPVNARDQRSIEYMSKRSSGGEYQSDVSRSPDFQRSVTSSQVTKLDQTLSHEDVENDFGALADGIDQLDTTDNPRSKRRIAKFTGDDWILKTKHQVQEMSAADPLTKQVSQYEQHSKNLQSPLEDDTNIVAQSSSGGLTVVKDSNVEPCRRVSAPERTHQYTALENSSTNRKISAPVRAASPFKSYTSISEKESEKQRQNRGNISPSAQNESGRRVAPFSKQSSLSHSIPPLQLYSTADTEEHIEYDTSFISRSTPPEATSPRSNRLSSDTKPPSPFRNYRSSLEFEGSENNPERRPPSPLSLTSSVPTAESVRRIPPLTPRSVASFQPYQSVMAPSMRDRNLSESEFLSPRTFKSAQLGSASSYDSGFNGSLRPDRLNSTHSDVFRSSDHFGDLDTTTDGYLSDSFTPRNALPDEKRQTIKDDDEDTECERDEPVEFEQMMSRLFHEEDYQSDDEGLRQKCLDVFKTIHHQDTVFSEFRKLLRFKRRNSVQKGPIKAHHPNQLNGIHSKTLQ